MWHGASSKPDAIRALKQVRKGDRVLCYHSAPRPFPVFDCGDHRDPYPDRTIARKKTWSRTCGRSKSCRAGDACGTPRQSGAEEMKLLKNVRLIVSMITTRNTRRSFAWLDCATPGIPLP